jgi:hypothetical protein
MFDDFRWKWPNRAARADVVARTYCLVVLFLERAQRMDGNATHLPMVVRALDSSKLWSATAELPRISR